MIFAGLAGAIIWTVTTWYAGIPSSSSHALIGGVVGAMLADKGSMAVQWNGVFSNVLFPAILAIAVTGVVAAVATWLALRITDDVDDKPRAAGFRLAQKGSASMIALAHGTNDAQKTMGIITLALIANNTISSTTQTPPTWVVAACGTAIALGAFVGGWRIIRTLGKGLTTLEPPQGFAAETSSAATILTSSYLGFPLSTTQVCTSSVVGSGIDAKVDIRWPVFGRMIVAWVLTFPSALGVGTLTFSTQDAIGGNIGVGVTTGLLGLVCLIVFVLSRRNPITPSNVNDDWDPTDELPVAEPAAITSSNQSGGSMSIIIAAVTATSTAPKPLIDWAALGQPVAYSLVIGFIIVTVVAFSIRLHAAGEKDDGGTSVLENVGAWLGVLSVVSAAATGIWFILHKG